MVNRLDRVCRQRLEIVLVEQQGYLDRRGYRDRHLQESRVPIQDRLQPQVSRWIDLGACSVLTLSPDQHSRRTRQQGPRLCPG